MLTCGQIREIKKELIDTLQNYSEEEKIKLNCSKEVLQQLLFDKKIWVWDDEEIFEGELIPAFSFDLIKKLDLSGVSFDKVNVSCLDFSGSKNVIINPQKVWRKSLLRTKCCGVEFNGLFDGVTVDGADFTGSKNARINPQTIARKSLRGTKCCDVEFTRLRTRKKSLLEIIGYDVKPCKLFDDVNIEKADFTGSKNAIINPQTIEHRSLIETKCRNVEFIGSFDDVKIEKADFTGSKNAIINPQTIYQKTLYHTKCKDVEFIGSFDGVNVINTDFTGSKNAIINPQTLYHKCLFHTNFCDAILIDTLYGIETKDALFEGCKFGLTDFNSEFCDLKEEIKKIRKKRF